MTESSDNSRSVGDRNVELLDPHSNPLTTANLDQLLLPGLLYTLIMAKNSQ